MNYAICYNTFIPLRSTPSEKSEMVSQILFGEFVEVIENNKASGFSRVRNMFDDYEGWCNTTTLYPMEGDKIKSLTEKKTCITKDIVTFLYSPDGVTKLHLSAGSTLYLNASLSLEVYGITYIIPEAMSIRIPRSMRDQILASAKKFLHVSYLWGGRSSFGTDCSGFVQNVFKQSGVSLPRDASQQATHGQSVSFIEELLPGDIMFFDNEEGSICHTGIYLGNNKIIHASGRVKIDTVDHQGIFSAETRMYTHKLRIIKRVIDEKH